MKKCLWVVALALVVSSVPAGLFAADPSIAQQDQVFLKNLAQQAQEPVTPGLSEAPVKALPAGSCINLNCWRDSDCWPHCGGEGASFCSANHWCVPY